MRVVFVLYGAFETNSARHVVSFANKLVEMGAEVTVVGDGDPKDLDQHQPAKFISLPRRDVLRAPREALARVFGPTRLKDAVLHGWTPRESVRRTIAALRHAVGGPLVIHLEDNETAVTTASLGASLSQLGALEAGELRRRVGTQLTHPVLGRRFMEEADGITVITPALRHVAPEHVPKIILAPGADEIPPLTPVERQAVRLSAGIADGERMVVYPGGMNSANQRDILDLYFAIDLLCRRGHSVKLVRTGDEAPQPVSDRFDAVRRERSVDLSRVTRARLIKLLAAADLLIQPGAPGDFDDFRLPSKLPDFFASGRPVILPRANLGLRVRDGEEALLLDRGDANEIAEKAALLLSDPIRAEAIGAAGRRFASTLSWQAGADALMKFYRRLGTL